MMKNEKNKLSKPKQTFRNLTAEKRRLIEKVLVEEFAREGYRRASLNNVVKRLGIAKGSLYQYFDNKEAIFLFVFERFTRLVKSMVGKPSAADSRPENFWQTVRRVWVAGIVFIDKYPAYYQLYLNALFEQDIPRREEIISRVRLFSMEFFGPLVAAARERGGLRPDVPLSVVVFMIDAAMDRFLQSYARSYLDDGLELAAADRARAEARMDTIIETLKNGIAYNQRQDRVRCR
ncbi:TetR/AcrR family transcriptional regulator [Desulfobacterota bacterium M19]